MCDYITECELLNDYVACVHMYNSIAESVHVCECITESVACVTMYNSNNWECAHVCEDVAETVTGISSSLPQAAVSNPVFPHFCVVCSGEEGLV